MNIRFSGLMLIPAVALLLLQACSSGGGGSTSGSTTSSSSSSSSSGSSNGYTKHDLAIDLAKQLTTAYAELDSQTQSLKGQTTAYCTDTNDADGFASLKTTWQSTMLAWQYVQGVNFGPIAEDSRFYRMSFYPVGRQQMIDRIIDLVDGEEEISMTSVQGKAASLQGLVSLEYVLFRDNALVLLNDNSSRYCEYLNAVADNLVSMTTPVAQAWSASGDYYQSFILSSNAQQSLIYWIEGVNFHMSTVLTKIQSGNVSEIESPLAQTSMLNVKENLRFLQEAFIMTDANGIDQLLDGIDAGDVTTAMLNRLNIAQASLAAASDSIVGLNSTDEGMVELDKLSKEIHDVQEDLAIDVAGALDVTIIFNGADGD